MALRFGVAPDALLGHGGEAWVYALDDDRVLRILRDGGRKADVLRRMALVEELALSQPVYRLPEVLDVGEIEGRTYAIERRLPGRSMLEELGRIEGAARERLIEAYLDTSASLGDLHLPAHAGFGDLIADDSIVAPAWRTYLEERAARNLARSTPELRQVDPAGIAGGLPDASTPSFVHLDAFAGNFLTDGATHHRGDRHRGFEPGRRPAARPDCIGGLSVRSPRHAHGDRARCGRRPGVVAHEGACRVAGAWPSVARRILVIRS